MARGPWARSAEESVLMNTLTTSDKVHGLLAPGPPMPAYRLNHADAVALTAYLKSLPRGKMPPWMHH